MKKSYGKNIIFAAFLMFIATVSINCDPIQLQWILNTYNADGDIFYPEEALNVLCCPDGCKYGYQASK